jgi:hypothetical protein
MSMSATPLLLFTLACEATSLLGCDSTPPLPTGSTPAMQQGPGSGATTTNATGGGAGAAMTGEGGTTTVAPGQGGAAGTAPPIILEPGVPGCATIATANPATPLSTNDMPGCNCTRRPGPGQSFACAVGANESASAEIGPEGGTLMLMGQQGKSSGVAFSIDFPPGAFATATMVKVTETSLPPPHELIDYSPVYLVEPFGVWLAKLAAVRVPWGSTSGVTANGLAIYERDETTCAFAPLGDSYVNAGFNQGSIAHLGYLLAGAPRTAAGASCP